MHLPHPYPPSFLVPCTFLPLLLDSLLVLLNKRRISKVWDGLCKFEEAESALPSLPYLGSLALSGVGGSLLWVSSGGWMTQGWIGYEGRESVGSVWTRCRSELFCIDGACSRSVDVFIAMASFR